MKFLSRIFGARAQFLMINAQSEEDKAKVTRLGVQSIILACVGTVLCVLFVVLASLCAHNVAIAQTAEEYTFPVMSFVGAIVFYAFALAIFLSCNLSSTLFAMYQRKVNKKTIGTVALILSWTGFGICILATILLCIFLI